MQKSDAFQTFLKAATVGGIVIMWVKFTKEVFMLSWDIMANLPIKDTYKPSYKVVCENCQKFYDDARLCEDCHIYKAVCEKCQKIYDDDEYHLIHGARLCEDCRLKK